ncbi:hypothetical protein K3172_12675 [Qipengyuania sp. 6B39]|uniref:hypothetical protein n=1 Tax=Qipengyuania proteolytica TaxID=2867239 RepID=UPI001C8B053D|nr:hypothetical protein [Qipengyuania proteolytica]MBX7496712.1 hypothetical protein [Qipengyuania proteolytica]
MAGPEWDFVAFEVKSWGAPVTSWRMLPDGSGSWTEAVRTEGEPPTTPPALAWHDIEAAPANYAALESILRRLPHPAPNYEDCDNFMNDAPYGTLRLTRGATTTEIAWNDGCMDEDYRAFVAVLKEADEHVASLGKAAPVSRTDDPPSG